MSTVCHEQKFAVDKAHSNPATGCWSRENKTYTLHAVEEPGKLEAVELSVVPGLRAICQSLFRSSSLTSPFGDKEERLKSLIATYRDPPVSAI